MVFFRKHTSKEDILESKIMEEIIQEKISADHLLYVSLKYTKTCDVIMNLLLRWRRMIETSIDALLDHAKKKKKISSVPETSVKKLDKAKEIFKKNNDIMNTLKFYEMLRKLEELRTERIGEFRKNVNLKIFYMGGETDVDLKKLKDYALLLEKFIGRVKQYIAS
ncbi:MAG TPA: hypothetical protein VJA20_00505 [Candidatus Nanoarchaeia archaeon]|nr:hypothetical protein [Candidatus Nanoarchaeia archaeon]